MKIFRLFEKHPEYKELHPDLLKYKTREDLIDSSDFEIASMAMFNQIDMFLEKAESEVDEALKALKRHGRMQSKVKNFTIQYFKVWYGNISCDKNNLEFVIER